MTFIAPPTFQKNVVAIPAKVLFVGPTISMLKAYCDTMREICTKPPRNRRMLRAMGESTKAQQRENDA